MSRCSKKKKIVSRNELRETENIGVRDIDVLITNLLLQVSEFLFLICVKKTISMKTLVLRVIKSSRRRNCLVRGYIHSLFVSKALTRSYLARSGFRTNNSWIAPRTSHVNYISSSFFAVGLPRTAPYTNSLRLGIEVIKKLDK